MTDDWDFYPLRVDDQLASIFVDLGIRDQVPLLSHPTLAYLRVYMLTPRENGLSSQDEFESLIGLEEEVVSKIIRGGKSVFVGRNTSGGNRDFYFYTSDPIKFVTTARKAMRVFSTYNYETGARKDPNWRTYFEFLHPSDRSMQLIMNRRVRQNLEKHGDKLSNERPIDHRVLLPNLDAQSAFANHVTNMGFKVNNAPSEPKTHGSFSVEFSRTDYPAQIDDVVLRLFDDAKKMDGIYDGWGCHIAP